MPNIRRVEPGQRDPLVDVLFSAAELATELARLDRTIAELEKRDPSPERDGMLSVLRMRRLDLADRAQDRADLDAGKREAEGKADGLAR